MLRYLNNDLLRTPSGGAAALHAVLSDGSHRDMGAVGTGVACGLLVRLSVGPMSLPSPYYEDEAVTLYHGDCLDIIPLLPMVDHVITDPPFSQHTHSRARSNRGHGKDPVTAIDFTAIDFTAIDALLGHLAGLCRRWFIGTLDWRHVAQLEANPVNGWEFVRFGVWVKTNPMPQLTADRPGNGWDAIAYLHRSNERKRWSGGGEHGNWIGPVVTTGAHPTAKPEAMIASFVERFTDPHDLILDPFAGSGTTGVAAKRLGRRAILIEREEKYCAVAARRLSQASLQLFTPEPIQTAMFTPGADS